MPVPAPEVTVVMPVYNAMPYLDQAIQSIVAQTMPAWHLAIYDDCSTDGSYELACGRAARDPRITVIQGKHRLGPRASSQRAALLAQTELVARMDADDIAHPERLAIQLKALAGHPQAVLIGSTFELIDANGRRIRNAAPSRIEGAAPPFAHPSIIYRNSAFIAAGGYRTDTDYFEDLDLYRRMSGQGEFMVINRPLIQMRFAGQNVRLREKPLDVLRLIDRQYPGHVERAVMRREIVPMAFYTVAVLSILSLARPRLLGLMVRKVSLDQPAVLLAVFGMIVIAEASPRLARGIGLGIAWLREFRAWGKFAFGQVYRWQFRIEPNAELCA